MNPKILLLGNGFDLYHNLPTMYSNFLHVVDFLLQDKDMDFTTVGSVFGDEYFTRIDKKIVECYSLNSHIYDRISIDQDKLRRLITLAENNMWLKYLLQVFNQDKGWIDFEKEIGNVLAAFEKFFASGSIEFHLDKKYEERNRDYVIKAFDFFYEWIKRDASMRRIAVNFPPYAVKNQYQTEVPYGSGILEIDKEEIIKALYRGLQDLSEMLKIYLTVFVDNTLELFLQDKNFKTNRLFERAEGIINFNYTSTYEVLYNYCDNKNVFHIHGSLRERIVLGLNPDDHDELVDMDTSFICFKKYYQRVLYGTDSGYREFVDTVNQETNQVSGYRLYVVGHSLDVTDKDIITEIFDAASEIVIMYHDESAAGTYIKNLVAIYGKEGFDRVRKEKNLIFDKLK